jgi:hypothetical protein
MMEWLKENRRWLTAVAVVAAVLVGWAYVARGAQADTITKGSPVAIGSVIANSGTWTGCGIGVGAAYRDAEFSAGGPGNVGVDGQSLGGRFLCDYQAGSFVMGGNVDYDALFGDINTVLGGNAVWSVGGRVGPLVNPSTLLFASAGWTRADTAGGNLDGWYIGGGIETKLPNSPLYLVLEYQKRTYDLGVPGVDFEVDVIRAGANLKLNFGR